jgi:DNA polymerase-3 subunit beta
VLIPRKGVLELRRAIETREAPCQIGVHQGNFVLKADDVGISVKLVDGQFPPYDQVIPKDNDRARRRVAPRARRRAQARGAHVVGQDLGRALRPREGQAARRERQPRPRAAKEEIDVPYKGAALQIGFNARYFIDLLAEIESTEIRLELSGELDPGVVRPGDGSDYVGVVMPMRL